MATNKHKREKSAKKAKKAKASLTKGTLPTREILLKFLANNPSKSGKRELAKAFGLKGEDRIGLKRLIGEMQEEGLIVKSGKRLRQPGELPPVGVINITTRDRDGGLLAVPAQWNEHENGRPPAIQVRLDRKSKTQTVGVGDRALARLMRNTGSGVEYSAKIIKRLEKNSGTVLGVVQKLETHNGTQYRLEPIQRRQKELELSEHVLEGAMHGDLVEVEQTNSSKYGLSRGRVIKVIGSVSGEKAASMIALHANEIRHIFPEDVLEAAKQSKPLDGSSSKNHEDWRDLPLITIDPADAKDHDDAIYALADKDQESGGHDGHIVFVAIADVSYYVRTDAAMDREAVLRGNSVYFPDQVIPMLPERISNDLCSLRENEDRPALAVRMVFNAEGNKIKHSFHRILMRSHAKLAYTEAQDAIDGSPNAQSKPLLETVLKPLWEAYGCLKRGRDARQPLELDLPERKILLTGDGQVDRVIVPDRLDAHKLVEEFMIQANVAAAETLLQRKQPLIYRTHDAPSLDKLEKLREFLKSMDISLARPGALQPMHFNQILSRVKGHDREELVNQVVLRSQSQAEYSTDNIGHFGLHLARYAHFTSPIRRYADLTVHRALLRALNLGPGGMEKVQEDTLADIAAQISLTERRAMQAERETVDRLIANHLSDQIGSEFSGRINGVTRAGLFVTLADTGADGFVPISKLGEEYFHFDESSYALVGENTGMSYQMGQNVEVKLVEAAPVAGALRFEMISDGVIPNGPKRSRRTNTPLRVRKSGGPPKHRRKGRR